MTSSVTPSEVFASLTLLASSHLVVACIMTVLITFTFIVPEFRKAFEARQETETLHSNRQDPRLGS